jgi:hypothetical protein
LAATLCGLGWIYVQVLLNSAIQLSSLRWVLSRAIAIYQTFVFGGNALGSFLCGQGANAFGPSLALAIPAGGMLLAPLLGLILPIREGMTPIWTQAQIGCRPGQISTCN